MVMADREFQIHEELLLRLCNLQLPPGARAKGQILTDECKKAKEIASIHVERANNRIRFFQMLKEVTPVKMPHHIDDIVVTALSNLKSKLIEKKSN